MSSTSMRGRQGVPSLSTLISPAAVAQATKSFSTRSSRRRSDMPQAVAKRSEVNTIPPKSASRSWSSVPILERA